MEHHNHFGAFLWRGYPALQFMRGMSCRRKFAKICQGINNNGDLMGITYRMGYDSPILDDLGVSPF